MGNAAINVLVENAGLDIEQSTTGAGPRGDRLAHLADHIVVDELEDLVPKRGLGDVRIDIDEEVVFERFGLDRGMRENIARVGLDRDFVELFDLSFPVPLLHRTLLVRAGSAP